MTELVDGTPRWTPSLEELDEVSLLEQQTRLFAEGDIARVIEELVREHRGVMFGGGGALDEIHRVVEQLQREEREQRGYYEVETRRSLAASVRKRIFERDAYRCVQCGGWDDLTIDHILAVANGGTDEDENLQAMCRSCNSRKGTR